jgi:hypothetical protein
MSPSETAVVVSPEQTAKPIEISPREQPPAEMEPPPPPAKVIEIRAKEPRRPVKIDPPPKVDPLDEVRRLVRAAEAAPGDEARFRAASSALSRSLASLEDPALAKRLSRMIEVAAVSNDASALVEIADQLERAGR